MNTWLQARKPWTLFLLTWGVCLGAALLGPAAAEATMGSHGKRTGLAETLMWPIGGSLLMALGATAGRMAKRRKRG